MKIGFLDYNLNCSHATHFTNLIRKLCADQAEIAYAWDMKPEGEDWCVAQGVKKAGSLEEVVEKSDALMILAPDNISEHLQLFQKTVDALKSPKPVYIDKYLHTHLKEAETIVSLANARKIPVMSSSALRFAPDLEKALPEMKQILTCSVKGYGPMEIYAVHTIALGMRIFGSGLTRVINTGTPQEGVITADFGGRKMFIQIVMSENSVHVFPWSFSAFCASDKAECGFICVNGKVNGGFFENLICAVGRFFATGVPPISDMEMLDTVALLELADLSRKAGGVWLPVNRASLNAPSGYSA